MRESKVETYLKQRVRDTGGFTRKLAYVGRNGAPDELCGWPGVHILVETKRPSGPGAEAHQAREHDRLRGAGFVVEVVHTLDQVDALVMKYARRG